MASHCSEGGFEKIKCHLIDSFRHSVGNKIVGTREDMLLYVNALHFVHQVPEKSLNVAPNSAVGAPPELDCHFDSALV